LEQVADMFFKDILADLACFASVSGNIAGVSPAITLSRRPFVADKV
jgi:hypothetical protein